MTTATTTASTRPRSCPQAASPPCPGPSARYRAFTWTFVPRFAPKRASSAGHAAAVVAILTFGSAACGGDVASPVTPTVTTATVPATYDVVVTGTVVDGYGARVPDASVRAQVSGVRQTAPPTLTNANGEFRLVVAVPFTSTRLSAYASADGYIGPGLGVLFRPGAELAPLELRLQPRLVVGADRPVVGTLLPRDPAWVPWESIACDPCQRVDVDLGKGNAQPVVVSVSWAGQAKLGMWLYGTDALYDNSFVTVGAAIPSGRRLEATIPAGFGAVAYVGLAGGGVLDGPVGYEVSIRPASIE